MTHQRRYAAAIDRSEAAKPRAEMPTTLPAPAYGPEPIMWAVLERADKPAVWAWISWRDRPAERVAAHAIGWNDRVVCVEWDAQPGGTRQTMVWRNAVTVRRVQ